MPHAYLWSILGHTSMMTRQHKSYAVWVSMGLMLLACEKPTKAPIGSSNRVADQRPDTERSDYSTSSPDQGMTSSSDMTAVFRDQSVVQPLDQAMINDQGLDSDVPDAMPDSDIPFAPRPIQLAVSPPQNIARQLPSRGGRSIISDTGQTQLSVEQSTNSPLAGLARCAYWLQVCMRSGEGTLDDCALSVPTCQTQPSWMQSDLCCPASCFDAYAALRMSGVSRIDSLKQVYFEEMSCFPELRTELGQ